MNHLSSEVQARLALRQLGYEYSREVFFEAAYKGDKVLVELIVQAGAPVDAVGKKGKTALMWAAAGNTDFYGHLSVVKFLVEEGGADVSATSKNGMTARDWAERDGNTEIARYLKSKGG